VFTILTQLSPITALEILDHNGHFVPVPPIPGTLVIVVGDFLQRISNDVFSSTIHRVINRSPVERFSIAYFYDADPEAWIEPLSSCGKAKYPIIQAGVWQKQLLLMPRYRKKGEVLGE
jgi:isopenicillin N synthase-like dioxygenase